MDMTNEDALESLIQAMRNNRAKPTVITSYSDSDASAMKMLLNQSGLTHDFQHDADEIRCPCPFHENHGSPTLWVNFGRADDLPLGAFVCFSCGERGIWPKLERKLTGSDTSKIGDMRSYDVAELLPVIEPRKGKDIYSPPTMFLELEDDFVWSHPDGDFPRDFLVSLGAKITIRAWYDKSVKQQFSELRLWLPVWDGELLVGDILAALERPDADADEFIRKSFKKYINSKSLESKETLWPLPYVTRRFGTRAVVLVEGPADAMRLILNGIPALAILGTGTWSDIKADRVFYIFDKVCACFDGDAAGRKLTESVTQSLQEKMGPNFIPLWLPDDMDPGKFTPEDCAWLHGKLK